MEERPALTRCDGFTLRSPAVGCALCCRPDDGRSDQVHFASAPTVEAERFIRGTVREREAGRACASRWCRMVRHGCRHLPGASARFDVRYGGVGLAIASEFWGSGLFSKGATVLTFAFDVVGVHRPRPERRQNGRATAHFGRRRTGGHLEKIIPSWWQTARPGPVGDHRPGLVSIEGGLGREGQLGRALWVTQDSSS